MNNPFELEACILHHLIKQHPVSRYGYATGRIPNFPPTLPQPEIFTSLYNGAPGCQGTPQIAECAVHLELLEAFLVLKRRVLKSNALDYTFRTQRVPRQARSDPVWLRKRGKKWDKFLDLAVLRFEVWWEKMAQKIGQGDFDKQDHLPPLDVLMVWHTYMLNPGVYREDLKTKLGTQGDENSLHKCAKFPWKAIHEAINHESRAYTMTATQEQEWKKITLMPGSLFDFLSNYEAMNDETLRNLAQDLPPRGLSWLFQTYTSQGDISTSPIDLKAAVQRQESFVEKMGNFLWIRSPYLEGTLSRALTRYSRFTELLKLRHKTKTSRPQINSKNITCPPVVPAIDIDIVWHTHQLDPSGYNSWCMEKVGVFVDHNDNLDDAVLTTEVTKEVYWKKFGVPYGACFCWFCEGVKSKSEKIVEAETQGVVDWAKLGRGVYEEVEYCKRKEMTRRI